MTQIENTDPMSRCYTENSMWAHIEHYFLDPPAGSAAARAAQFGIDLTLTVGNLKLTPEERIQKLDGFIEAVAKLKNSTRVKGPVNAIAEQDH